MIDMKQAVQIAKSAAVDLLTETTTNLEEVERESYKGREVWSITLSLPRDMKQVLPVIAAFSVDRLQYKRFLIDVETGELVAMQLRDVASQ
jgi:hypothetical protein